MANLTKQVNLNTIAINGLRDNIDELKEDNKGIKNSIDSLNDTVAENNKTITGLTFQVKELTELKTKIVRFFKTL